MRKICVVTGTRAEYGLLYWLIREIKADSELQLQLIVTGMHLSSEFGLTYQQIEQDGFKIDEKIEMLLSSDTAVGVAKSLGLGVIGFADALDRLKPDILVLLGDRYEILAAAQAAMIGRIPIAHIHGGERTEGAIDEAIRHSITKMAHLHFVAAEEYRKRVIQLGEQPDRIWVVGAMCLDNLQRMQFLTRKELENQLLLAFAKINFLVTYHPVTLETQTAKSQVKKLLKALDAFPEAQIIFTKANSDTDGRVINQMLEQYCCHVNRAKIFTSLGSLRYLSLLRQVDLVIGNSSSGILEAPFFQKPTVNIGARQKGRLKAQSVLDCGEEEIQQAIEIALSKGFQKKLKSVISPYGVGRPTEKIMSILKSCDLRMIIQKEFYDNDEVKICEEPI